MTDEALFYRSFIEDVRACAGRRARTSAAEVERRMRVALIAPPSVRERRWERVVTAVRDLLGLLGHPRSDAAERLRAFVRENADLGRAREFSIGDFFVVRKFEKLLLLADGARYLTYRPLIRAFRPPRGTLDEIVPHATRRLAEFTVFGLCGGAAIAALWFAFVAPIR